MRIEDRAGVRGVAAARETKVLANRLPHDLAAGIQNASHDGRVHIGYVAFQDVGTVHHRDPGDTDVVFDGDFLARERSGLCALDGAPPVPGIQAVFRGRGSVTRVPPVLDRQGRLRKLIEAAIRGQHTVHEIAEGCQVVLAELQIVGSCDSSQFRQGRFAQDRGAVVAGGGACTGGSGSPARAGPVAATIVAAAALVLVWRNSRRENFNALRMAYPPLNRD